MVTPFLKNLNTQGGTLYVFPSVSKDLTRTFVSNDYEFKFSHFACLNIPDIVSGTVDTESSEFEKGLYLETFGYNLDDWDAVGEKDGSEGTDGMGKALAEHLQNYVMNFETAILNGEGDNDDYDNSIMTTVSEKVFFNWLQKVGAIQFDEHTELYTSVFDRTVQYIGNIDVVNTVEINGDSFEELYIHIPSTVGASSTIYFRDGYETDNKNYLDKDYYLGPDAESCILGREGTTHPFGLSTIPLMDKDNGVNMYKGDRGHTIDFRDSSYAELGGITEMNNNSPVDFEFNAVLIYYDFLEKTPTVGVKKTSTNLYGILFLDNITDIKAGNDGTDNDNNVDKQGYFQRYPKKKETIYGNGNSFALKVDLKIDTIPDTTYNVNQYVDPNNVISMLLYEKAIVQMQKCIDLFYSQKDEIIRLKNRVDELETMLMGIDSIESLKGDIERLYNLYDDNTSSVNQKAVLDLVELNSKKLDKIIRGERDVKVSLDTDMIKAGTGVALSKVDNKLIINSEQKYNINTIYYDAFKEKPNDEENPIETGKDIHKDCYVVLKPGENLAVLYLSYTGISKNDINIIIDDTECDWKKGQSFKLHIDGELEFADNELNGINIKTSATSILINGSKLVGKNNIELICIGDDKFITTIK